MAKKYRECGNPQLTHNAFGNRSITSSGRTPARVLSKLYPHTPLISFFIPPLTYSLLTCSIIMSAFDYTCIGPNWTREYITAGLDITSDELRQIFDEAKTFFIQNPDIKNLKTTKSKNIIRDFGNKLRQKHPAFFRNVPPDTLWDREIAMGIMRFASHKKPPSEARTQIPGPWPTPTPDPVTHRYLRRPHRCLGKETRVPLSMKQRSCGLEVSTLDAPDGKLTFSDEQPK